MASFTYGLTNILFSRPYLGRFTLFEADTDGQNATPISAPIHGDYSPVSSPNDDLIAFTRAEGGSGSQNIWIMHRDGTAAHPITSITGDAINPTWSPNGSQIAFTQKLTGEMDYSIWIMNADGSEPRKFYIPLTGIGGRVDWSPTGEWLAFYAGPPDDYDIYLVSADGSKYRRMTEGGNNLGPSFSPNGYWLVFTSSRNGDSDLFIIRLDKAFLTPLTINDTPDWQPRWGR